MIDLCYPLAVLANRTSWQEILGSSANHIDRQVPAGKRLKIRNFYGSTEVTVDA